MASPAPPDAGELGMVVVFALPEGLPGGGATVVPMEEVEDEELLLPRARERLTPATAPTTSSPASSRATKTQRRQPHTRRDGGPRAAPASPSGGLPVPAAPTAVLTAAIRGEAGRLV